MRAKRCDRCLKFYEPYDKIAEIILLTKSDNGNMVRHYPDLCPQCQQKLIKWLDSENFKPLHNSEK